MNLPNRIQARQISEPDIPGVVDLLARGFDAHSKEFWHDALGRLADHRTPDGFPKYGYLLESDGSLVGAILLIFSRMGDGSSATIRCNLSSWYVEPAFRSYAGLLAAKALSRKDVTYLNVSAAPHTWPLLKVQGYRRYSEGIFYAAPALQVRSSSARVTLAGSQSDRSAFGPFERELLSEHSKYGCLSLQCVGADQAYPFVFRPRLHKGVLPYLQLIYCRDVGDLVRFAGPLGRYLLSRGYPLVALDANGPIPGLIGQYRHPRQPKFFKGPERPRLGDLAYTEIAMLGI